MNTQNLEDTHYKLISFMQDCGYYGEYIARLKREINFVLTNADSKNWESYLDVYDYYVRQKKSAQVLRHKLTFLGIIERFDLRGEYPDGRSRQQLVKRGKYELLSQEFKQIIDTYCAFEHRRGKKKSTTINGEARNTAGFLYEQQLMGISTAELITQKSVLSVFLDRDGNLCRSCSYKKILATVFKANVPANTEVFSRILAYLPDLRQTRKNIQYLTDEEVVSVKRVLNDPESGLSLRDKAIGTLVLVYGFRCCDVARLGVNEVDLHGEKISISQQKTEVPLELPLTAAVGNCIYDYVTTERPKNECEFVFLTENRPYRHLKDGSVGNIATKIMKFANIRQNVGDRKGFHIFRHRLLTGLLANDVAQPVISSIAGHTSPKSLESYLSADFKHLKECAISVDSYPVSSEVFANA